MIINSSDQVSRFRWLRRFPVPRDFNVTPESRIQRVRTWPAPAGATRTKAFDIYRYDPDSDDNPRLDRFHIDLDDCGPIVLDALIWIKNKVHPPISVRGRFGAARLSAKAAKFRDMLIADLPRRQRFGEAFTVELRIGARPRHRSQVDDEIDARFLEQIGEFDDRSSGMTYFEEDLRVGSDGTMAPSQRAVTAQI